MKKLIKPAVPGAVIPDIERGRDLPPEGLVLDWTPHWALLERRGDIVAEDVPNEGVQASGMAASTAAPTGDAATAPTFEGAPLRPRR